MFHLPPHLRPYAPAVVTPALALITTLGIVALMAAMLLVWR
jgi:hypothetical protein